MKKSIATKIIFDLAAGVSLLLFVGGVVLIKVYKNVLSEFKIPEEISSQITQQNISFLTIILVLLIIVLIVAIYFSLRKIVINPIKKIQSRAETMAKGNLDDQIDIEEWGGEISQLAESFNEMTRKLKESYGSLEQKVKERTEEVVKRVEELEKMKTALTNLLEDAKVLESNLESERDKSVSIIASISEGLFVVNSDYKIILMNSAAEKLFGLSAKDCLGKSPLDIVSIFKGDELLAPEQRPVMRTIKNSESVLVGVEDDFYFQLPSGKRFPVALATSPIKTKELVGAVVVFHDVTEEKLLNEAKSSFISIASHQLRTPLTSIRWYTEMLIDEDIGALNDQQKEFAQQVYDGAARLNETINTLLAISRIESGKLHEDPIDINLKPFIKNITNELAPLISQNKLSVKVDMADDVQVNADTFMLHEVITNLIANSIRYTDGGGHIAFGCIQGENETTCMVSDNGIGIPDNQKDRIFDKFFRAGNAVKKVPDGSGLGLGLVKGFVEKWGGRVWFESTEGKGTTFYFTIPHRHTIDTQGANVQK